MTDYNDGKWHGWNGGECPVHPESLVSYASTRNGETAPVKAGRLEWGSNPLSNYPIIAFRVINPYVEPPKPREFWINDYGSGDIAAHETKEDADKYASSSRIACILVREVLE